MSKRFRDTEIWQKEWYRKLIPEQKCAWSYLCDKCDNVGVISLDREAANFLIGAEIDWEALLKSSHGNIELLGNGKWWLRDFCDFQYGELREECKPHTSYLALLRKHGLEGYTRGIHTPQEKEKEKEKEKELEKDKRKISKPYFNFASRMWENIPDAMVKDWALAFPACNVERELVKMATWLVANPTKCKTRYARFINGWLSRTQDKGGTK